MEVGVVLRRPRILCVASLLIVISLVVPSLATAAPPLKLDSGLITDDAGVLGDQTDEVKAALDQLNADQGAQLFVVYVGSFDGMDSNEWADETANINGLGLNDILLAVAVDDRQYAWSVDGDFPLTDAQLADVAAQDIEPALQRDDWAGAAIGAADGYNVALGTQTIADESVDTGAASEGVSVMWCVIPGIVLLVLIGASAMFVSKRKGKSAGAPAAATPGGADAGQPQPDMKTLETHAGQLLVDVDDALRTSEQELGFAEAEFGTAAVEEYRAALEKSKSEVAEAFRIQQKVYDAEPEDEATRRTMLEQIITLAEGADARLDEKAESFAALRDISKRVADVLAAAEERLNSVEAGLAGAAATVTELKSAYAPSALGEVADDDIEAAALVPVARDAIAAAREADAAGNGSEAALAARQAEEAVAGAERLLEAISSAKERLDTAKADLAREVTALEQATATAEAQGSAKVAPLVDGAKQAIERAKAALGAATMDPLAELEKVRGVQELLVQASGAARDAAQAATNAIGTARQKIAGVEAYIQTRRAAVGAQARAALTEAKRRADRAQQLLAGNPEEALSEATSAQEYADSASRYAQGDVSSYDRAHAPAPAPAPTRAPTPAQQPSGGNAGAAVAGAVLGSVLRGAMMGGGMPGGMSRGGFGGSGRRSGGMKMGKGGRRGGGGRF